MEASLQVCVDFELLRQKNHFAPFCSRYPVLSPARLLHSISLASLTDVSGIVKATRLDRAVATPWTTALPCSALLCPARAPTPKVSRDLELRSRLRRLHLEGKPSDLIAHTRPNDSTRQTHDDSASHAQFHIQVVSTPKPAPTLPSVMHELAPGSAGLTRIAPCAKLSCVAPQ